MQYDLHVFRQYAEGCIAKTYIHVRKKMYMKNHHSNNKRAPPPQEGSAPNYVLDLVYSGNNLGH